MTSSKSSLNSLSSTASHRLVPRLASSRQAAKWTSLPADFAQKVSEVFGRQFKTQSQTGEFVVEGRIYPGEVLIRVGYLETGRLKQINFEASMDIPKAAEGTDEKAERSSLDLMYACIDLIGSAFEEYFQTESTDEMDISASWQEFDFEGETIFMQTSSVNSRLEDEADRLLGLIGDALVSEESESEDALAKAEIDSELAAEVQRMIREGKHPLQKQDAADDGHDDLAH